MGNKKNLVIGVVLIAVVASLIFYALIQRNNSSKNIKGISDTSQSSVVATVNGRTVTEAELVAFGNGATMSRADLMDNYITRVLLSQKAEKDEKALASIELATVNIQFEAWMRQNSAKADANITETELQAFYENEMPAENFKKFKLSFAIGDTQEEAMDTKREWKRFGVEKDEWISLAQVPYGMGGIVKTMKKGDVTPVPLLVRLGWIRIRVDAVLDAEKPSFLALKEEIRRVLLERKVMQAAQEARRGADIRVF